MWKTLELKILGKFVWGFWGFLFLELIVDCGPKIGRFANDSTINIFNKECKLIIFA
jgi:hypothetical protein